MSDASPHEHGRMARNQPRLAAAGSKREGRATVKHQRAKQSTTADTVLEMVLKGGTVMGGSQLGLGHIYAEARREEFVREAEIFRAIQLATGTGSSPSVSRTRRVRALTGRLLIGLGQRIMGASAAEAGSVPVPNLRLAR